MKISTHSENFFPAPFSKLSFIPDSSGPSVNSTGCSQSLQWSKEWHKTQRAGITTSREVFSSFPLCAPFFSDFSLLCNFPRLFKYTGVPTTLLMGSALACDGSILKRAGKDCVQHGLLPVGAPWLLQLPKPCHIHPTHPPFHLCGVLKYRRHEKM